MCNYNGSARDSERLYGSLWRGYTVEYEFQFVALQHRREFEIWRDRENNSDIGRGGRRKMSKERSRSIIGVMAELLPCPFCGGEADTYEYEAERNIYDSGTLGYVDTEYYTKYGVGCPECGCIVAEQMSIEKAITAWNTRTPKERGEEK